MHVLDIPTNRSQKKQDSYPECALTFGAIDRFSLPALAGAQSIVFGISSPPVAMTSCRVDESYSSGVVGGELEVAPQIFPSGITLRFVNQSNIPATHVTFVVSDGRYMQRIVDKGFFSPGAHIEHGFPVGEDIGVFPHATGKVFQAEFADGNSWRAIGDNIADR